MAECSLTNLAACLPEKLAEYLLKIINAPLQPFLDLTKALLTEPVNVQLFHPLWAIMVYIISLFYGLFFLFAGFNFMISGYDLQKRIKAKLWLRNTVLMVLFVQASFLLYGIVIELAASLTAGVMDLINQDFFLLTLDNLNNIGLELVLLIPYLLTLLATIILLSLRYLLVSAGLVFFPLGIFLYFIPPLEEYGRMIIHVLAIVIFIPFFSTIVLLAASLLLDITIFQNFKIVITMAAFSLVDIGMLFLLIFGLIKAALSVIRSDVGRTVSAAAGYFA